MGARQDAIAMIESVTGQKASDEQRAVLEAEGGKCILASAGSGKTTVLTWDLAVDIKTGAVDPNKLLCTTYSKAGANEMSTRVQALLDKLGMHCRIEVRTMHSAYYKVLRDFGIVKNVISNGLRAQYIREACREARVHLEDDDLETVDSLLSYQVNNLLDDEKLFHSYVFTLDNVTKEQYGEIRLGYSRRKQENGYIDFDDMQMYMYMLCVQQKNENVLNYCHNMWQYFYVDEFQDISKIQFAILQALCPDSSRLLVIGDDDQCGPSGAKVRVVPSAASGYSSYKCIEDIVAGDKVLGHDGNVKLNGHVVEKTHARAIKEPLVVVKTERDHQVKATAQHQAFVGDPESSNGAKVYLAKLRNGTYKVMVHELVYYNAEERQKEMSEVECRWVIDIRDSVQEASDLAMWLDHECGMAQGTEEKALELMERYGLDPTCPVMWETHPEWDNYCVVVLDYTFVKKNQYGKRWPWMRVETKDTALKEKLRTVLNRETNLGRSDKPVWSVWQIFNNLADMEDKLGDVLALLDSLGVTAHVQRTMSVGHSKMYQTSFCNLRAGMTVPVYSDDTRQGEHSLSMLRIESVSREWYHGSVYDLTIPATRNFVMDDVLVHNCIYEWRGACPAIIQNICGYYDLQKFVLSTNYRCAGEIVKLAAVGIENNVQRCEKSMVPYNEGGNVRIINTAASLYDMSKRAMEYIDFITTKKGAHASEVAVLSRNNAHLGILGNMLMRAKYFVDANEGTKISQMPAFKDIKNVMILSEGTTSAEVAKAVLWRVCPFLGTANSAAIAQFMRETNCTIKQAVGWLLDHVFAHEVGNVNLEVPVRVEARVAAKMASVSAQGVESLHILHKALLEDDSKERLIKLLRQYQSAISFIYKSEDRQRFLSGIVQYFEDVVRAEDVVGLKSLIHLTEQTEQSPMLAPPGLGRITLSTMHGAKGREWRYVILLADDNIAFPSFDGINTMLTRGVEDKDVSGSVDENRRLHYVAMTRAKQELAIFAPVSNLSVFTLEAMSIITKGDSVNNNHIISMAKSGGLSEGYRKEASARILDKQSWFYYSEPWGGDDWQLKGVTKENTGEALESDGVDTSGAATTQQQVNSTFSRSIRADVEDTWGDDHGDGDM